MVVGAPYTVGSTTYTPEDRLNYDEVGYVTADADGGDSISGAHHTLPLPSYVEVTSLATGRTVLVRMERRGPMASDHLVALSAGAMSQLGAAPGTPVRVRRVVPPEEQRAVLRSGQAAPLRMDTPMSLVEVLKRRLPASGSAPLQAQVQDGASETRPAPAVPANGSSTPPRAPNAQAAPALATTPAASPAPTTATTRPAGVPTPIPAVGTAASSIPAAAAGAPTAPTPTLPALAAPAGPTAAAQPAPRPATPANVAAATSPVASRPVVANAPAPAPAPASPPAAPAPAKPATPAGGDFETAFSPTAVPTPALAPASRPPVARPAPAAATPAPAARPAATGEGYVVQAAAFSSSTRAERVARVIGGTVSQSGNVFRVRTGPFPTRAAAEASLAKVQAAGYREARIFTNS